MRGSGGGRRGGLFKGGGNTNNKRGNNNSGRSGRNLSAGGGGVNRGQGICFDFQKGKCHRGGKCKFLHGTAGQSNARGSNNNFQGQRSGGGSAPATSTMQDSNRLIKRK